MRNKTTKKNMDLDLRRYGKMLYTKAEESGGSDDGSGDSSNKKNLLDYYVNMDYENNAKYLPVAATNINRAAEGFNGKNYYKELIPLDEANGNWVIKYKGTNIRFLYDPDIVSKEELYNRYAIQDDFNEENYFYASVSAYGGISIEKYSAADIYDNGLNSFLNQLRDITINNKTYYYYGAYLFAR